MHKSLQCHRCEIVGPLCLICSFFCIRLLFMGCGMHVCCFYLWGMNFYLMNEKKQ